MARRRGARPAAAPVLDDRQIVEAIQSWGRQRHIQMPPETALSSVIGHLRSGNQTSAAMEWRVATGAETGDSKKVVAALAKTLESLRAM